jgi:hypothetical protein
MATLNRITLNRIEIVKESENDYKYRTYIPNGTMGKYPKTSLGKEKLIKLFENDILFYQIKNSELKKCSVSNVSNDINDINDVRICNLEIETVELYCLTELSGRILEDDKKDDEVKFNEYYQIINYSELTPLINFVDDNYNIFYIKTTIDDYLNKTDNIEIIDYNNSNFVVNKEDLEVLKEKKIKEEERLLKETNLANLKEDGYMVLDNTNLDKFLESNNFLESKLILFEIEKSELEKLVTSNEELKLEKLGTIITANKVKVDQLYVYGPDAVYCKVVVEGEDNNKVTLDIKLDEKIYFYKINNNGGKKIKNQTAKIKRKANKKTNRKTKKKNKQKQTERIRKYKYK